MADPALRRAAWVREGGRCAVTGHSLGDPDGAGWHLHHRRPGGMGGTTRSDQQTLPNVIAVTGGVHRRIHGEPSWSEPRGLLLPTSEDDPAGYPVQTWRGWVFLTTAGGYQLLDPRT